MMNRRLFHLLRFAALSAALVSLPAALPAAEEPAAPRTWLRWQGDGIAPGASAFHRPSDAWDLRAPAVGQAERLGQGQMTAMEVAAQFKSLRIVGHGTVSVPAGDFEARLRREEVILPGGREVVQFRWIGSGATTLALLRGPAKGADEPGPWATDVMVLEAGAPAAHILIHDDDLLEGIYQVLDFMLDASPDPDRNVTVPLSTMTSQGYATGADFAAATAWDFTPVASIAPVGRVIQTIVPVSADETCNAARCGFSLPSNDFMARQDNLDTGALNVAVFDVNPAGDRHYLRAGAQAENSGGEQRFCYDGDPSRGEVPQYVFANPDGADFYMQLGDPGWSGTTFNCFLNLFTENCGVPWATGSLYTDANGSYSGRFFFDLLSEGTAHLPSGHWADVLLLRQVGEFQGFLTSACGFLSVASVRQPVLILMSPGLGSVAQINGPQNASSIDTWTGVTETNIQVGLLPPLSIQVDSFSDTEVQISWTPGDQVGIIDRAKVYWGTDTASTTPYPFNSDANPGQVAFGANSATISGLTPGTPYYFTVTFLSLWAEPDATPNPIEYESLLYPTTFSGNGNTYPAEVMATTTSPGCTPTAEVQNLMLDLPGGGDLMLSWDALVDPCLARYIVLGADDPTAFANFTPIADAGLATSVTGPLPPYGYFLVVAEGAGGQRGPLGHYGQ